MRKITLLALVICLFSFASKGQIKREPVDRHDYQHHRFDKTTNFRYSRFDSLANFRYSQFDSSADFRYSQFDLLANFLGAQFNSEANFFGTQFNSEANFKGAQFDSAAVFIDAQFNSRANFEGARFDSLADFKGAGFDPEANFWKTQFDSEADFKGARFVSLADFHEAQFDSEADFRIAQFDSEAHFRNAQFDSEADFRYARFDSKASFHDSNFQGDVRFDGVTLPDTLDFQKVKTAQIIDLTYTVFDNTNAANGQKCFIDLREAPVEKFKFTYDNFRVFKPDTVPDKLNFQRLTSVYEKLLKNFKDNGYTSSYQTLDREYQDFKSKLNPNHGWSERQGSLLLNFLNEWWHDYGYRKGRIWRHTAMFLMVFTLLNWLLLPYLINKVYEIEQIKVTLPEDIKLFKFKRFVLSFFYTAIIFFGLKVSIEQFNFDRHWGVTYIFLQYIIGLICVGYLVNFIISSQLIGS